MHEGNPRPLREGVNLMTNSWLSHKPMLTPEHERGLFLALQAYAEGHLVLVFRIKERCWCGSLPGYYRYRRESRGKGDRGHSEGGV
jgi:hypothetical protein